MKKLYPNIIRALWLFLLLFALVHIKDPLARKDEPLSEREKEEEGYDKPEGYLEFYRLITTAPGQVENGYKAGYQLEEFNKGRRNMKSARRLEGAFNWVQRGPGNVGGRTRDVLIDPDDPTHNTWYAAAASGGVWKTADGGNSWQNLTNDLLNLAANSLAMAPSDHNVLYMGTGEGYGGFGMVSGIGIYRSATRGSSWTLINSTYENENFRWINKIVVDASDENTILVATNKGLFKTFDGGLSWDSVYYKGYAIQDIAVNPMDPLTLYAAVNSLGIIKSYDGGSTWFDSYSGIGTGYRFMLAVSPVDTNYIFTSVEAPDIKTDVYISRNGGSSWYRLRDTDFTFVDFLGVQGWFNNIIAADPFNKNKVFIGGVNLGSIEFGTGTGISDPGVMRVDTFGTGSFLSFVNFGGDFLRGGLSTGLEEGADVEPGDYVSVEIRFGPGIWQKAHRFTVPEGEGAGVPPDAYTYRDYIPVPFQAWDIDNDRQLMVSFRDQDDDGAFDLVERVWNNDISGREYIFVHALEYDGDHANSNIAQDGGHFHKMLYFVWPALPEDKNWDPDLLPESGIRISYGTYQLQDASTTVLADDNRNKDLHVDHHDIEFIVTSQAGEQYTVVDANDGGLGISFDKGLSWKQINSGYHTTQFYGVAKKPGMHEYIGGMQDNGTWQSPWGIPAGPTSEYKDQIAGDGFEALWHPAYPHRILGSSYYNLIRVTTDGGRTWDAATNGITGEGPFITRLSNSPENPDLVFTVGNKGVYRHRNFGVGRYPWELIRIDTGWSVLGQITSSHNVEVSLADPSVVWAGAGMFEDPDLFIFLSQDYGKNFKKVNIYEDREMGYITGIATHPYQEGTACLLFSMDHKPKILRTKDFGNSWEDISGFGADSSSSTGFPDVAVYSLLVFPDDPRIMWAGTEIGIYESIDAGDSWHMADIGFPAVSVWQMFIQDNTIVVATHGRGIWSCTDYPVSLESPPVTNDNKLTVYPNPTHGIANLEYFSDQQGMLEISVYEGSGKRIAFFREEKDMLRYFRQIDLSGFSKGGYLISVTDSKNRITHRVVVH